jgi:uncharacterized repeat protein (TIGR02543 family)
MTCIEGIDGYHKDAIINYQKTHGLSKPPQYLFEKTGEGIWTCAFCGTRNQKNAAECRLCSVGISQQKLCSKEAIEQVFSDWKLHLEQKAEERRIQLELEEKNRQEEEQRRKEEKERKALERQELAEIKRKKTRARFKKLAKVFFVLVVVSGVGLMVNNAVEKSRTYIVSFNSQGGSSVSPIEGVAHLTKITEPISPTRSGYLFEGWYNKDSGGNTEWDFNSNKVGSDLTLFAKWIKYDYEIGSIGPAGGLVFYDKGSNSNGWRFLEAAPYGWYDEGEDSEIQWGKYGTYVGGTLTEIGTGASNTEAIVAKLGAGNYAAKVCADYTTTVDGTVYDDWFLPSKDELSLMYQNLHRQGKGGFSSHRYWSSSELYSSSAWRRSFSNGSQGNDGKSNENYIRAVQAF